MEESKSRTIAPENHRFTGPTTRLEEQRTTGPQDHRSMGPEDRNCLGPGSGRLHLFFAAHSANLWRLAVKAVSDA